MSSPPSRQNTLISLIPHEIKNLANSADHFFEFSTLVAVGEKPPATTSYRLQAAGYRLHSHRMSRQICSQNSAKSAKIASKSLPLTTLFAKIHNLHRISGLLENMFF
jgi:hypothetical protein